MLPIVLAACPWFRGRSGGYGLVGDIVVGIVGAVAPIALIRALPGRSPV